MPASVNLFAEIHAHGNQTIFRHVVMPIVVMVFGLHSIDPARKTAYLVTSGDGFDPAEQSGVIGDKPKEMRGVVFPQAELGPNVFVDFFCKTAFFNFTAELL